MNIFSDTFAMTGIFVAGGFAGALLVSLMLSAGAAVQTIDDAINESDAERLAFLDDHLIDAVFHRENNQWGLLTQDRRFLSSGDSLHEAITRAQTVLQSNAAFGIDTTAQVTH